MSLQQYLEKYNNGTLTDAEWEKLTQQMLNEQFDQEKRADWEQKLAARGITRKEQPSPRFSRPRVWLAAASLLLLVAATVWITYMPGQKNQAQKLAASYLEQPFRINDSNARGGSDSSGFNRGRAMEAFNNKDYERAIGYLQLVENERQIRPADYFHLGLCEIYRKQPDYPKALTAFGAARRLSPDVYYDEINWFSALCYVMTGDNNKARAALQQVIDSPSSRNQQEARLLLQQIK